MIRNLHSEHILHIVRNVEKVFSNCFYWNIRLGVRIFTLNVEYVCGIFIFKVILDQNCYVTCIHRYFIFFKLCLDVKLLDICDAMICSIIFCVSLINCLHFWTFTWRVCVLGFFSVGTQKRYRTDVYCNSQNIP